MPNDQSNVLNIPCERCGQPMVIRVNRESQTEFLGCAQWPECTATRPLPAYLAMIRAGATPLEGFE